MAEPIPIKTSAHRIPVQTIGRLSLYRRLLLDLSAGEHAADLLAPARISGRRDAGAGPPRPHDDRLHRQPPEGLRRDVDFYLEPEKYTALKNSLLSGKKIMGARVFERADLDMVELFDPDIDALAYVSTNKMSEAVRVKLSDATKL